MFRVEILFKMISRSGLNILRSSLNLPENVLFSNIGRSTRILGLGFRFTSEATSESSRDSSSKTDSNPGKPSDDVDHAELESKLAEKDKLIQEKEKLLIEVQDKYRRSLAENENVLQRGRKMTEEAKLFGIQRFSKDLLEVADILEKATESVPQDELEKNVHLKNLYEGLTLTDVQLKKVFSRNGLEKVDPVGEKFDPHSHEAVFQLDVPDKEEGTVAIVQKIGYKLNGRTLRPALVGVVKKTN